MTPNSRLQIIVLGYLVRGPLGGLAWTVLQYVAGLARLGHDVYFVEDSDFVESDDPCPSCYNPVTDSTDADPTYGLEFARAAFERLNLADRWAYYDAHTAQWFGPCAGRVPAVCKGADLLLNLAAANPLRPWSREIPTRALIDSDPAFTQIRHLTNVAARELALQHTVFFSFAENLGHRGCTVPSDGLPWQATRQPIVLDAWPVTHGRPSGQFTSVLNWDSYPAVEYNGVQYGMKSASFQDYLDLPQRTGRVFTLIVGSATAPHALLRSKGWTTLDPSDQARVTRDPWTYQQFIQESKGEFCINKHGFVVSRSGWFSERSAAYLASGRPVVAQDTGFSSWLQAELGVVAFSNLEEAAAGIEAISRRYELHCGGARAVAQEYFDARVVLPHLIERAMASPRGAPRSSGPVAALRVRPRQ